MKTEITEVIDEDSGLKMKHAVLTIIPENAEDERILQDWQDDHFHIEKYRSGKNIVLMMYCKTEKKTKKGEEEKSKNTNKFEIKEKYFVIFRCSDCGRKCELKRTISEHQYKMGDEFVKSPFISFPKICTAIDLTEVDGELIATANIHADFRFIRFEKGEE